jgi:hypothetical protein
MVVKYGLDDSHKARCTTCGRRGRGKISPQLLIVMGASDNTPRKTAEASRRTFATFGLAGLVPFIEPDKTRKSHYCANPIARPQETGIEPGDQVCSKEH